MKTRRAFTLMELMISVTILIILATAAVLQSAGIQNILRFNGTFSKVIIMTQRARNLAFTGKEPGVKFGVYFEGPDIATGPQRIILFADRNNDNVYTPYLSPDEPDEKLENAIFNPPNTAMSVYDFTAQRQCGSYSQILYGEDKKVWLFCNSEIPIKPTDVIGQQRGGMLEFKLTQESENRKKCFTVHMLSGTAQIQNCGT